MRRKAGPRTHERRANGWHATRLYASYREMRSRCCKPKHVSYHRYGGRGIQVCSRWLHPEKGWKNFAEDMGERPEGESLDRIDPEGHYTPDNCRWATRRQQANNRRDSHKLTIEGRTQTLTEWSQETGTPRTTIAKRLCNGESPKEAVHRSKNTPKFIQIGNDRLTAYQWSKRSGVHEATIATRIRAGWDARRAVFEKPRDE